MGCRAVTISVGGVIVSTSDYENALPLMAEVGDDALYDGPEENISNGNNTRGSTGGAQYPPPTQTTPPGPITQTPNAENNKPATPPPGVPVSCTAWDGADYDLQLSPNFKLRDLSINALFANQVTDFDMTFTKQVRCCNLQAWAKNIGEPMKAKFPSLRINSAIRNANSTAGGLSQHVKGEAVDIQVPGWSYEDYWQNAEWVKSNIPYDQFIFEHSPKGTAWYHLSYSQTSNRSQVLTMFRNNYSPGLKKFY